MLNLTNNLHNRTGLQLTAHRRPVEYSDDLLGTEFVVPQKVIGEEQFAASQDTAKLAVRNPLFTGNGTNSFNNWFYATEAHGKAYNAKLQYDKDINRDLVYDTHPTFTGALKTRSAVPTFAHIPTSCPRPHFPLSFHSHDH